MGLHRGTKRGTIYPDRVKSLLESKWEQGFGENFLKRYFNLEGFFKKTGFFERFAIVVANERAQKVLIIFSFMQ